MKFLIVFLAVVVTSQCLVITESMKKDWIQFKMDHGKQYDTIEEEEKRMLIFMENKRTIDEHNDKHDSGIVTFRMGVNMYADMTHEEFFDKFTSLTHNRTENTQDVGMTFISPTNKTIPDSIDWRTKGAVTPVKDQMHCGSCWSFSATGSIEGQHFRKTGVLVSLSEQNLMDCSTRNHGCRGGYMLRAFQYVKDNGGIDTEESYPYEAKDGTCRYNPQNSGATVSGYVRVERRNEKQLQEAVGTIGPVSISIEVIASFHLYKSGVYDDSDCDDEKLRHGVLAVGYGTEDGKDYWIVKNSWGPTWGEKGYIKIARNKNMCGVATDASYPLV